MIFMSCLQLLYVPLKLEAQSRLQLARPEQVASRKVWRLESAHTSLWPVGRHTSVLGTVINIGWTIGVVIGDVIDTEHQGVVKEVECFPSDCDVVALPDRKLLL